MKHLKALVERHNADTRPVDMVAIASLEKKLGFALSAEYVAFLSEFGLIEFEANEMYGLGVPDDYYLNVLNKYNELAREPSYPTSTVPLLELGDGHYYLYQNESGKVLQWAAPNGGIVKTLDQDLETFLSNALFTP